MAKPLPSEVDPQLIDRLWTQVKLYSPEQLLAQCEHLIQHKRPTRTAVVTDACLYVTTFNPCGHIQFTPALPSWSMRQRNALSRELCQLTRVKVKYASWLMRKNKKVKQFKHGRWGFHINTDSQKTSALLAWPTTITNKAQYIKSTWLTEINLVTAQGCWVVLWYLNHLVRTRTPKAWKVKT
jgi:hypothetical protein